MANNNSRSESYEKAGVDITAGYRAVELMKKHISRTITPGAMPSIGNFGGLFAELAARTLFVIRLGPRLRRLWLEILIQSQKLPADD